MLSTMALGTCLALALIPSALCTSIINYCLPNPCKNYATCVDGSNSCTCICPPGFTGTLCEIDIDDCKHVSCSHRGTCIDGVNGFTCICQEGCSGTLCSYCSLPPPVFNPCKNGGSYVNHRCFCPPGFCGPWCEAITCGNPPTYPYALLSSTGNKVGDKTTYTCQPGFILCVKPAISTCLSSGIWTVFDKVCGRSYFTWLLKGFLYPIPCQSCFSYVKLSFWATITGTFSRFRVIGSGKTLFLVQFRRYNYQWFTEFYQLKSNGYYDYRWYKGLPLYVKKSTLIHITWKYGKFIFEANGHEISHNVLTTKPPEFFAYYYWAIVKSLNISIWP